MADVVRSAGILAQIALVAGLRWRLFRNSLRATSARLDFLARILVGLLAAAFAGGIGLGLGVAAHALVSQGRHELLVILLWAVFLGWHLLPFLTAELASGLDFRLLRRFPLRFAVFFLLSLAYGLVDPSTVAALFWLACIAAGITLAQPDMLLETAFVLAVLAAMNLLLNRLLLSWLERLLARRRIRETLGVLFLLGLLSLQFFGVFAVRWGQDVRRARVVAKAAPALRLLPPGLAGSGLADALRGNRGETLASASLLAGYGLVCGLLLRRRLRAQYLGEDLCETQAPLAVPSAFSVSPVRSASAESRALSFLPGVARAVFEKELRYLFRNTVALFTLAVPLILIAFLRLSLDTPLRGAAGAGFFPHTPGLAFPASVAYMFLIVAPLAHNIFAYDGRGIQLLIVAPVRFRDVLLGKNLHFGMMVAAVACLVWLQVCFVFAPPTASIMVETFSALLFATLVHLSLGNLLSLYFPRRIDFGVFRRQRASGLSVLIGLGVQIVVFALVGGVLLATRFFGGIWVATAIFLALGAAAWQVYRVVLEQYAQLAADRREVLTAQLCR